MKTEHPSVYKNTPITRHDYEAPISIGDEAEALYAARDIGLGESFLNGAKMIGVGLTAELLKTGYGNAMSLALDEEDALLTPEQAKELYDLDIDENIHPVMAEYYSDVNKFENGILEGFSETGLQKRNPLNAAATWLGMFAAVWGDIPERAIEAGIGKGFGKMGKIGKAVKLVADKLSKPAAKFLAGRKLSRTIKATSNVVDIRGQQLLGAKMIDAGIDMRKTVKASVAAKALAKAKSAKRMQTISGLAKVGSANALIEAYIAYQGIQRGATYDMKTAAAFGMFAPVALNAGGRALAGSSKVGARAVGKVIEKPLNVAYGAAYKAASRFFKGTAAGRATARKMGDVKFGLANKIADSWNELKDYVQRNSLDPKRLEDIEDGMTGKALVDNPLIQKIESVFGKRGVQEVQKWANAARMMGYRVHLEDAFSWLSKSTDEIKADQAAGRMTTDPSEAFVTPAKDFEAYDTKHKLKKPEPPTKPVRGVEIKKTKDVLVRKINNAIRSGGEDGKYGEKVKEINDLTEKLGKCYRSGGGIGGKNVA